MTSVCRWCVYSVELKLHFSGAVSIFLKQYSTIRMKGGNHVLESCLHPNSLF